MEHLDERINMSFNPKLKDTVNPGPSIRSRVQFTHPRDGSPCVDETAHFSLHVDGIECSTSSLKGNDYLCLTLELKNCSDHDRTSRCMTIFSCVLQNVKEKDSRNRFLLFLEEYIRTCTVSGKAGAYIWYDRMWHHWRWSIADICADSVAQEEIMEFVNKKMTAFPCWFDPRCKKLRFNVAEYCWQEMNAPSVCGNKTEMAAFQPASAALNRDSGYRLTSVASHFKTEEGFLTALEEQRQLEEEQKEEAKAAFQMVHLFQSSFRHQWIPVVMDSVSSNAAREQAVERVMKKERGELLDDLLRTAEGLANALMRDGRVVRNEMAVERVVEEERVLESDDESGESVVEEEGEEVKETCLQDGFDFNEGYVPSQKELSEETKRYVGGVDVPMTKKKIAECEGNMLVPRASAKTIDMMHLVKNVVQALLNIIAAHPTKEKSVSCIEAYLKKTFFKDETCDPSFTLSSLPAWVLDCALMRMKDIPFTYGLPCLDKRMFIPSYFKAAKTHDCMIFAFSLFLYVFQDSLCIPAVFAAAVIIQGMAYTFNFDGDLRELSRVQTAIIFFLNLLQGEVKPSAITISLHTLVHLFVSVICTGNPAIDNCLNQESMYALVKRCLQPGRNPEKNVQKVLRVQNVCAAFKKASEKEDSVSLGVRNVMREDDGNQILQDVNEVLFRKMTVWNARDDSVFREYDWLPFDSVVDKVVHLVEEGKSVEEIKAVVEGLVWDEKVSRITLSGLTSSVNPSGWIDVYENAVRNKEVFSSFRLGKSSLDNPLVLSPMIGFLRLFNGRTAAFLIVGYTVVRIYGHAYHQALCIHIPTESLLSFFETQHCGLIKKQALERLLQQPVIIPISLYRLVLGRSLMVQYNVMQPTRYGLAYMKLCIRQCQPIGISKVLECVKQGEEGKEYNLRSGTK